MINSLKFYFISFKLWVTELIFGVQEMKYEEVQEDDYLGGQCFYDVKTGKHECE